MSGEPELFITVQRRIGEQHVTVVRYFDVISFLSARVPGEIMAIEIRAMLKELNDFSLPDITGKKI